MRSSLHAVDVCIERPFWGRVFNLTLWVLQVLMALAFLYFGASKFNSREAFWIQLFATIGIGQWFRYFTGALEVVCAILLVTPRGSAIGAGLLACTMVGAILTHLFVLREPAVVNVPLVMLFVVLIVTAWARRPAPWQKAPL